MNSYTLSVVSDGLRLTDLQTEMECIQLSLQRPLLSLNVNPYSRNFVPETPTALTCIHHASLPQLFPSRLDTSPVHAAVFASPGNHHLAMTAFNSASNVTASLIVSVITGSGEEIASPRLLHSPYSATRAIVNFTLKYLPPNAKRILFVTSR